MSAARHVTLADLLAYIEHHASAIYIRVQRGAHWKNSTLARATGTEALAHAFRWIREGAVPVCVRAEAAGADAARQTLTECVAAEQRIAAALDVLRGAFRAHPALIISTRPLRCYTRVYWRDAGDYGRLLDLSDPELIRGIGDILSELDALRARAKGAV